MKQPVSLFQQWFSERADEWTGPCFTGLFLCSLYLGLWSMAISNHSLKCLWWCDSIFDLQGWCSRAQNPAQTLPTCSLWSAGPALCTRDNWNNRAPQWMLDKPSEAWDVRQPAKTQEGGNIITADSLPLSQGPGSESDVNFESHCLLLKTRGQNTQTTKRVLQSSLVMPVFIFHFQKVVS